MGTMPSSVSGHKLGRVVVHLELYQATGACVAT